MNLDTKTAINENVASSTGSTTLSTIVLNRFPIEIVVALLQSGDIYRIKVVEITPKITFLGDTFEETLYLQQQHEQMFKQLQEQPTPVEEFLIKVEQTMPPNAIKVEMKNAMCQSLHIVWDDFLKLVHHRKYILDLNTNFQMKIIDFKAKLSSLETACKDTMIPIEIESVQEFLYKFKQLRIDVLASLMAALKDGNELLSNLRDLAVKGTLDSRPDNITVEVKASIAQVEVWLEELHDRRNCLELAWQMRKVQLEQCLSLAIFSKELADLEYEIRLRSGELESYPNLGESEEMVIESLQRYTTLKQNAISYRDRALKITKAMEKLVSSGSFTGNEAYANAYSVLDKCSEYYNMVDHVEELLYMSKEFFVKANKALMILSKLQQEVCESSAKEIPMTYANVLNEIMEITKKPLEIGYGILADIGRSNANVSGIERTMEEIERSKIYLEELCTRNSQQCIEVNKSFQEFSLRYENTLSWLSNAEALLKEHNRMGSNIQESNEFLKLHHQLLNDIQNKGSEINQVLLNVSHILENIDENQRRDIDRKVESMHTHWSDLKGIVETRLDLVALFIQFLQQAEGLLSIFEYFELLQNDSPDEEKLQKLDEVWEQIKPAYAKLKAGGARFIEDITKVADPYLETTSACSCVEAILSKCRSRQDDVTISWESWTNKMEENQNIEIEKIIMESTQTLNESSKLDTSLYPIFTSTSNDAFILKQHLEEKLKTVQRNISNACDDIQHRVNSTISLNTKDELTKMKVEQIVLNLNRIKENLNNVSHNYRILLESVIAFLDMISETRNDIENRLKNAPNNNNYNLIKDSIMDKFRSLLTQSEMICIKIREVEPAEIKDHDIDRIISLLEKLKIDFENESRSRQTALEKQTSIEKYFVDINEIEKNLNDTAQQILAANEQQHNSLTSAKAASIGLEYFEQTNRIIENRIETFVNESVEICKKHPDHELKVTETLLEMKNKWNSHLSNFERLKETTKLNIEYHTLADKIDTAYKTHSEQLNHLRIEKDYTNNIRDAEKLIETIDHYISENESTQLNDLKVLSNLSKDLYGLDKTVPSYSDNITLFQSFFKLKSELVVIADKLKTNEDKQGDDSSDFEIPLTVQDIKLESPVPILVTEEKTTHSSVVIANQSPDISKEYPEVINQSPELIKQSPEPVKQSPELVNHSPEVAKQSPELVNHSPELAKHSPELAKHSPELIQHSPELVQQLPELCIQSPEQIKEPPVDIGTSLNQDTNEETIFQSLKETITKTTTIDTNNIEQNEQIPFEDSLIAPTFVKVLSNGTVEEGSSHEFFCTAAGNPLPIVEWYKNNTCIDDSPNYNFFYNNGNAKMEIKEVQLTDQAIFSCKAKNPKGTDQCSAYLGVQPKIVKKPPKIITPFESLTIRSGDHIRLHCSLSAQPWPKLILKHNGKELNESKYNMEVSNNNIMTIIQNASKQHSGKYTLKAINEIGECATSCTVFVRDEIASDTFDSDLASDVEPTKPFVQLPLKDISAFESKPVRLDCIIIGHPEPEVIWYHDNVPIKESEDIKLLFHGDLCSLVIQEVYLEDIGEYKVVAINSAGEAISQCKLSVMPLNGKATPSKRQDQLLNAGIAPKFDKLLTDIVSNVNDSIIFECKIEGYPKPTAKWYFNNTEIVQNDRIRFIEEDDGVCKLLNKNVLNDDKGVYMIKATNIFGDAKCLCNLNVKTEPLFTKQPSLDDCIPPSFKELLSDIVVELNGSARFQSCILGKPEPSVRWLINDQPIFNNQIMISSNGQYHFLQIPNVSKDTIGKITCTAENAYGKATSVAYLSLIGDRNAPTTEQSQRYIQEHNLKSSNISIKKQIFTTTHTSQVKSHECGDQMSRAHLNGSPTTVEELQQENISSPTVYHKSIVNFIKPNSGDVQQPFSSRQHVAPRFVTPLIGRIIDEGEDVILEAAIDGYPIPETQIMKNNQEIISSERILISKFLNKISIQIKNIRSEDAGRYSCTAQNPSGSSTSSADIVVKKSVFPPVFGRRLQSQIVSKDSRVVMEIEVSGTPEPIVKWIKDGQILDETTNANYVFKKIRNNYRLIIEKVGLEDAGKFAVHAENAGGESKSIADLAVMNLSAGQNPPESMLHISDSDGNQDTTEETITTETKRTTETTMSMEHKSPAFDDDALKLKYTGKPKSPAVFPESDSIRKITEEKVLINEKCYGNVSPKDNLSGFDSLNKSDRISDEVFKSQFDSGYKSFNNSQINSINLGDKIPLPTKPEGDQMSSFTSYTKEIKIEKKIISISPTEDTIDRSYKMPERLTPNIIEPKVTPPQIDSSTSTTEMYRRFLEDIGTQTDVEKPPPPPPIPPLPPMTESITKYESFSHDTKINQTSTKPIDQGLIRKPQTEIIFEDKRYDESKQKDYSQTFSPIIDHEKMYDSEYETQKIITEKQIPIKLPGQFTDSEQKSYQVPPFESPRREMFEEVKETTYQSFEKKFDDIPQQEVRPPIDITDHINARMEDKPSYFYEKPVDIQVPPFLPKPITQENEYDKVGQVYVATSQYKEVPNEYQSDDKEYERTAPTKKTAQMFEQKIKDIQTSVIETSNFKNIAPAKPPYRPPVSHVPESPIADLQLEPGEEPEFLYASRPPTDQKKSIVQTVKDTLKADLERQSTLQQVQGGVRIVPIPQKQEIYQPPPPPPPSHTIPATTPTPTKFVENLTESSITMDKRESSQFISNQLPVNYENVPPPKTLPIPEPESASGNQTPQTFTGYYADTEEYSYQKNIQPIQPVPPVQPAPPVQPLPQKTHSSVRKTKNFFEEQANQQQIHKTYSAPSPQEIKPAKSDYYYEDISQSSQSNIFSTSERFDSNQKAASVGHEMPRARSIPPSPSKFIKGEFRESTYRSDYEQKMHPVWTPSNEEVKSVSYKPIVSRVTPTGRLSQQSNERRSLPPPDVETFYDRLPRPKFEPIEKMKPTAKSDNFTKYEPKPVLFRPKPVAAKQLYPAPASIPPPPTKYYTAIAGTPQHIVNFAKQNIATETKNVVHLQETTENVNRVLNMAQTRRTIRVPTKFTPTEYRESDYESDFSCSSGIQPKWSPYPSDNEQPRYRRVSAPKESRSASVPKSMGSNSRVLTPMEFDTDYVQMPSKISIDAPRRKYFEQTQTLDRFTSKKEKSMRNVNDDICLRPSTPPEYGFMPATVFAGAKNQMQEINSKFKYQASNLFNKTVSETQNKQQTVAQKPKKDDPSAQVYRDESRCSEYGTKHIDPNTGLIYFKYDFGYEFGIIFPGQGKKFVKGTNKPLKDQNQNKHFSTGDLSVQITNEPSTSKSRDTTSVPHESKYDINRKRLSLPSQTNEFDRNQSSILKTSTEQLYRDEGSSQIINRIPQEISKNAPMLITPLKDIAIVKGHPARFECILQNDSRIQVTWQKNGNLIVANGKYRIEFRNGVCRLTVNNTQLDDAGNYICTGRHNDGEVSTSAFLFVSENIWMTNTKP